MQAAGLPRSTLVSFAPSHMSHFQKSAVLRGHPSLSGAAASGTRDRPGSLREPEACHTPLARCLRSVVPQLLAAEPGCAGVGQVGRWCGACVWSQLCVLQGGSTAPLPAAALSHTARRQV